MGRTEVGRWMSRRTERRQRVCRQVVGDLGGEVVARWISKVLLLHLEKLMPVRRLLFLRPPAPVDSPMSLLRLSRSRSNMLGVTSIESVSLSGSRG